MLYSHNLSTLTATTKNFGYNMSIMILVYVVLGGMGSMRGSIIAAIILTVLPEALRFLDTYRMLIYSIFLIGMMLVNENERIMTAKSRFVAKIRSKLSSNKKSPKGGEN